MRRRSLTFGQMPPFEEFKTAYVATVGYDGEYEMTLRGIDYVTAAPTSLYVGRLGRAWHLARALYDGVKELVAIWDSNIDAPTSDWSEKEADEYQRILKAWEGADPYNRYSVEELRENAGSLASSIMETLGFEWI